MSSVSENFCDPSNRLDFHFNASLTALNLAKYDDQHRHPSADLPQEPIPFSLVSRIFRHRLEGIQVVFETLTGCSL